MDNPTTKTIVHLAIIFVGIATLISMGVLLTVIIINSGGIAGWRAESIAGSITLTGMGILGAMTSAFMDNKTRQLRYDYKLSKRYYKLLQYQIKHKKD